MNFVWIILIFAAGVAVGRFWKELQAWADRVLNEFLAFTDKLIDVSADALVDMAKEGTRYAVKGITAWVQNIFNDDEVRRFYKEERIPMSQVPDEIKAQLQERVKTQLMKLQSSNN
ncbi:hypothetical protein [Scytonema sp. PCC 10023]|uniref:hypothetical protein n=1 Tax=Scytonema sp. PCC 10023 TaxID=1680591 RepID=UPI0039C61007